MKTSDLSPETLSAAAKDSLKLNSLIDATYGFCLEEMWDLGIKPDFKMFLVEDVLNPYSIMFLIKHYNLNEAEKKKIRLYLSNDGRESEKIADEVIKSAEIEEILQSNDQELPKNTIFSRDELLKNKELINNQYEIDEYNTTKIITNSLSKLSASDVLSLGSDFILDHIHVFNSPNLKFLFESADFNKSFKNITLKLIKNKKNTFRIAWVRNYDFSSDPAFLHSVLDRHKATHTYWIDRYDELLRVDGFGVNVSRFDFFKNYSLSYKDLDEPDYENHPAEIIQSVFDNISKNSYRFIESLCQNDMSVDGFKKVIDSNFLDKLTKCGINLDFNFRPEDYNSGKKKKDYLDELVLDYYISNYHSLLEQGSDKHIGGEIELSDVLNIADRIYGDVRYHDSPEHLAIVKKINVIYTEIMPLAIKNNDVRDYIISNQARIYKDYLENVALSVFKTSDNLSVNMLYLILLQFEYDKKNNKNISAGELDNINKYVLGMVSRLHPDNTSSVKMLLDYYGYKYSLADICQNPQNKYNHHVYDFLDYKNNFDTLDHVNMISLIEIDRSHNFLSWIESSNKILPKNIILWLLDASEKTDEYNSFLSVYINKNINMLKESDYYTDLLNTKTIANFIDLGSADHTVVVKELIELGLQVLSDKGLTYDKSMQKEVSNLLSKIPYTQFMNIIKEYLDNKNYKDYLSILTVSRIYANEIEELECAVFKKYTIADFEQLLKDKSFISRLISLGSRSEKRSVTDLDLGNDDDNLALAEMIFKKWDKDVDFKKMLYLFTDSALTFSNEFIKKHRLADILWDYKLSYEERDYGISRNICKKRYTPKEVVDIFLKLERTGKIFKNADLRNGDISNFFCDNFDNDSVNYLKTLELAKEVSPLLYVILLNNKLVSQVGAEYAEKIENCINSKSDILALEFMNFKIPQLEKLKSEIEKDPTNNYFSNRDKISNLGAFAVIDLTTYMKGVEQIIDRMGSEPDAASCLQKVLSNAIYITYYDERINSQYEYDSFFPKSDFLSISQMIFNKNPRILFEYSRMFGVEVSAEIKNSMSLYIKDFTEKNNSDVYSLIEAYLIPQDGVEPSGFRYDGRYLKYFTDNMYGLVKEFKNDNGQAAGFISYMLSLNEFMSSEIKYDYRYGKNFPYESLDGIKDNQEIMEVIESYSLKYKLEKDMMLSVLDNKPTSLPKNNRGRL